MNRVAKFEKVSLEQFNKDISPMFPPEEYFKDINDIKIEQWYNVIELPKRATIGAAGYDFYAPFHIKLIPGAAIVVPTGIRCQMESDWVLSIVPRSSLGFKYRCTLSNTVGIIDSDYYYSDNEGHIMLKLINNGSSTMRIMAGDRICQGIFLPYGITIDDEVSDVRNGGFGSTGK